jgi:hypothetical protein
MIGRWAKDIDAGEACLEQPHLRLITVIRRRPAGSDQARNKAKAASMSIAGKDGDQKALHLALENQGKLLDCQTVQNVMNTNQILAVAGQYHGAAVPPYRSNLMAGYLPPGIPTLGMPAVGDAAKDLPGNPAALVAPTTISAPTTQYQASSPPEINEEDDSSIIAGFFAWKIQRVTVPATQQLWRDAQSIVEDTGWSLKDLREMTGGSLLEEAIEAGIKGPIARNFRPSLKAYIAVQKALRPSSSSSSEGNIRRAAM